MTYDPSIGGVLLFGGAGNSGDMSDTWDFHAGTWQKLAPAHHPSAREDFALKYDTRDG